MEVASNGNSNVGPVKKNVGGRGKGPRPLMVVRPFAGPRGPPNFSRPGPYHHRPGPNGPPRLLGRRPMGPMPPPPMWRQMGPQPPPPWRPMGLSPLRRPLGPRPLPLGRPMGPPHMRGPRPLFPPSPVMRQGMPPPRVPPQRPEKYTIQSMKSTNSVPKNESPSEMQHVDFTADNIDIKSSKLGTAF